MANRGPPCCLSNYVYEGNHSLPVCPGNPSLPGLQYIYIYLSLSLSIFIFPFNESFRRSLAWPRKKGQPTSRAPYRSQNGCRRRHILLLLYFYSYTPILLLYYYTSQGTAYYIDNMQGFAWVFLQQTNLQSTCTPGFLRFEGCLWLFAALLAAGLASASSSRRGRGSLGWALAPDFCTSEYLLSSPLS